MAVGNLLEFSISSFISEGTETSRGARGIPSWQRARRISEGIWHEEPWRALVIPGTKIRTPLASILGPRFTPTSGRDSSILENAAPR